MSDQRQKPITAVGDRMRASAVCLVAGAIMFITCMAVAGDSVNGVWQSHGSALMVDIRGNQLELYQHSASTLVRRGLFGLVNNTIRVDARTELALHREGPHLILKDTDETLRIVFSAIAQLPPRSANSMNPRVNFDMLVELFAENYALFDLNQIQWAEATGTARNRITAQTTETDLFDVFVSLLAPLNDRHTRLRSPTRSFQSGTPPDPLWASRRDHVLTNIADSYLQGALSAVPDDPRVQYGLLQGTDHLYVLIETFRAAEPTEPPLPESIDYVLDKGGISGNPSAGIVIDLRLNDGGRESNGIALLDRLTDQERLVFTRETRSVLDGGFTPREIVFAVPHGGLQGRRPIIILTSDATASTGDIVALGALTMPWVSQIGSTTKGALSANLGLFLLNGWGLSLSNQRTYSAQGDFLEQVGIAPDIEAELSTTDVASGRDPALAAALALLERLPRPLHSERPVDQGTSGVWFDHNHAGEGWLIEVLDNGQVFATWFTYPPAGSNTRQTWVTGVGVVDGSRIVIEDLITTAGARFGSAFDPADVERLGWGRIEFHFASCDEGLVVYEGGPGYRAGVQRLDRLVTLEPGPGCAGARETQGNGARPSNYSGSWFDPQRAGEGWMLAQHGSDDAFVAWFTYDAVGDQAWMVGSGRIVDDAIEFSMLRPLGGAFGPGFDPSSVENTPWGTLLFEFADCDAAVVTFESDNPGFESGTADAVRLTSPSGVSCAQ